MNSTGSSSHITIKNKRFSLFLSSEQIQQGISFIAKQINESFKDQFPLFISVLNGSFMFTSDLFKQIDIDCELSFVKLNSYKETYSTGEVQELIGLNENIEGRNIIILEDIIDTGTTFVYLLNKLHELGADEVNVAALFLKPSALKYDIHINYVGFNVPDKFLVGYGLDCDGLGRNLKDIYIEIK
jgi:hypoxanthine phosphoribosyltransferase